MVKKLRLTVMSWHFADLQNHQLIYHYLSKFSANYQRIANKRKPSTKRKLKVNPRVFIQVHFCSHEILSHLGFMFGSNMKYMFYYSVNMNFNKCCMYMKLISNILKSCQKCYLLIQMAE